MNLSASPILPAAWDDLADAATDFEVSIPWLETMGPLLPGEPRWLVAGGDDSPQVGMYVRVLKSVPTEPRYDIAAILRGAIPSLEPRPIPTATPDTASLYPAVLAMLPGYTCVPAGPGAADPTVLRDALLAMRDWACEQGARSLSFLYVPERQHVLRHTLTELGAQQLPLYPTCVMPIDFSSIEDFLAKLPRRRRVDLRRLLRRIDESGLRLGEDDLVDVRDEVLELRLGSLRKYRSVDNRAVQAAALDRMIRHYRPEDRVVTTVRDRDRVVGFSLSLRHNDTLRALWCGQQPDAYGAYFVMLFYGLVAAALRTNVTTINYGTLKWQEKTSFGCALEQLTGYTWVL